MLTLLALNKVGRTMAGKHPIEAKRRNLYMLEPEQIIIIGFDTDDGPEHPLYDERVTEWMTGKQVKGDEDLVVSVIQLGVLQNVNVCRDQGRILACDGRRRILATREANKRLKAMGQPTLLVPALDKVGDANALFELGITANTTARTDNPMVSAKKAARHLNRGYSEKHVADLFHVTEQTIKKWVELLSAPTEVQQAIEEGRVSANQVLDGLKSGEIQTALSSSPEPTPGATKPKPKVPEKRKRGPQPGPQKRTIQLVLQNGKGKLDEGFEQALRWVLGEIGAAAAGVDEYMEKPVKPAKETPKQPKSKGPKTTKQTRIKMEDPLHRTVLDAMTKEWSYGHDISDAAGLERKQTSGILKELLETGEVEADGKGRGRCYRLVK